MCGQSDSMVIAPVWAVALQTVNQVGTHCILADGVDAVETRIGALEIAQVTDRHLPALGCYH